MFAFNLTAEWRAWIVALSAPLHGRLAWRLSTVVAGILFASGRRTVSSWWRAARVGSGFRSYYYVLDSVGRKAQAVAAVLLRIVLDRIDAGERLVFAIDDTPTKRYDPKVQGAGVHHNPTPGPAGSKFLYGHSWVTLSRVAHHARCGVIGLPLLGMLYVRKKDIPSLPATTGIGFGTKLEMAAEMVTWLRSRLPSDATPRWVVVDGGYAKREFLCTDVDASVEAVVQAIHDRWAIEQNYHDLKEVERIEQVQLRRLWSNVGALNLNLWVHTLIEIWAWGRPEASLSARSDRPWDDATRRPSHADRRRALQRDLLADEYQRLNVPEPWSDKIRHLLDGVVRLVA